MIKSTHFHFITRRFVFVAAFITASAATISSSAVVDDSSTLAAQNSTFRFSTTNDLTTTSNDAVEKKAAIDGMSDELAQAIRDQIKALEYSDETAEAFLKMVGSWKCEKWRETLREAKRQFESQEISADEYASAEKGVAVNLARKIRNEIDNGGSAFELNDVIASRKAQCLGYSQVFYVIGSAVGLQTQTVIVSEFPGKPMPLEIGHVGCLIHLKNNQAVEIELNVARSTIRSWYDAAIQAIFPTKPRNKKYPFFVSNEFLLGKAYGNFQGVLTVVPSAENDVIYGKMQRLDSRRLIAAVLVNKAFVFRKSEHDREALASLSQAIKLFPELADGHRQRGDCLAKAGLKQEAIAEFSEAIRLAPSDFDSLQSRAAITIDDANDDTNIDGAIYDLNAADDFIRRRMAAESVFLVQSAARLDLPSIGYCLDNLKALQLRCSYLNFVRGCALCIQSRWEDSLQSLSTAIALTPTDAESLAWRSYAYYNLNRTEDSVADAERSVSLQPNWRAYSVLSKSRSKQERWRDAADAMTQALNLAGDARDFDWKLAYLIRAYANFRLNDHNEALNDANKLIDLDSKEYRGYQYRGCANQALRKYPEAIADYSKAIELNPRLTEAYRDRGDAYSYSEKYKEARNDYSTLCELAPSDAYAFRRRSLMNLYLNDDMAAIEDATKAVALNPHDADAYYYRATAQGRLSHWQEDVADCSRAVEINPQYADAFWARGIARSELSQDEKAVDDFSTAVQIRPNHGLYYYARARAYLKLKKESEARSDLIQSRRLDPSLAKIVQEYAAASGMDLSESRIAEKLNKETQTK